jgi:hypothetical protein
MDDYAELCSFSNIHYTPAWYYQKFPGFFNVECYRILANWQNGVRTEEQIKLEDCLKMEQELETQPTQESIEQQKKEFYDSLDPLQYRWNATLADWQRHSQPTPECKRMNYTQAMDPFKVEASNTYTLQQEQEEWVVSEMLNKKRKFEAEEQDGLCGQH